MSKRDNFSYTVRKTVETKSNAICNNPECNFDTNIESNGTIYSIGKACHIEAAAPGGPRYNANTTSEYRKSIDNAMAFSYTLFVYNCHVGRKTLWIKENYNGI